MFPLQRSVRTTQVRAVVRRPTRRPRSERPFIARGQSVRAERAWTQPRGTVANGMAAESHGKPKAAAFRGRIRTLVACRRRRHRPVWARKAGLTHSLGLARIVFLAFTRGYAAKRGSPRAMNGRPLRGRHSAGDWTRAAIQRSPRTYVLPRSFGGVKLVSSHPAQEYLLCRSQAPSPKSQAPSPKSQAPSPKPQAQASPNPKSQAPSPKPQVHGLLQLRFRAREKGVRDSPAPP